MDYLTDIVKADRKLYSYKRLLERLHHIFFHWSIGLDENRVYDGLELRCDFFGCDVGPDKPCSVLEMLVAFAIRIDNEYVGDCGKEQPELIFWEMIKNLGLDRYHDHAIRYSDVEIDHIVSDWMDRRIDYNGRGGLFPLKHTNRDQRDLELWVQMQEYVNEKYER